ncbi:MAG TPA: hypothetical protein VGO52_22235 [Hyphomonadaceae bacterium]|jgi:hypothetical protein|nr:hypothetical protein [Hyphomonadaceae bacterium]
MPKILQEWTVQPHGELQEIDDGLLTVAGEIHMPLGAFPRRMTVIRLSGGRTAIWSAIALDEPSMQRIEAMGRPAIMIVPNPGHRLDSHIWKQRYPDIQVLAPPGGRQAIEEAVPVDATHDIFNDPAVSFIVVAGTEDMESALTVKRASGTTLITNDIIGHVTHPHGIGANIMARAFKYGVHEPQTPSTVKRYIKDPAALARQMRRWAEIPDLVRIIVSHGDPITDDLSGSLNKLADKLDD